MKSQPNSPDVFIRAESALTAIPPHTKVVVIMRHGEKKPMPPGPRTNSRLKKYDNRRTLTDQGKTDSEIMGRLLMRHITRIEHSCVPRCLETAQHMACGAKFSGEITKNPSLIGTSFRESRETMQNVKKAAGGFSILMDLLAKDGYYPGLNPVLPFTAGLARDLLSSAKPGVNVSISHHWIMYLILAAAGINIKSFKEEKISYLEPIFLWQENQRLLFHYRNMLYEGSNAFCEIAVKPQK